MKVRKQEKTMKKEFTFKRLCKGPKCDNFFRPKGKFTSLCDDCLLKARQVASKHSKETKGKIK